jgi:hypothetical protein
MKPQCGSAHHPGALVERDDDRMVSLANARVELLTAPSRAL